MFQEETHKGSLGEWELSPIQNLFPDLHRSLVITFERPLLF